MFRSTVFIQHTLFVFIVVAIAWVYSVSAFAGCYSDYCAGQRSGSYASGRALKYGGTYSQAGSDYMNYSRGYGTSSGSGYYSPYGYGSGGENRQISPEQQAEINRTMQQADSLINHINNEMSRMGLW